MSKYNTETKVLLAINPTQQELELLEREFEKVIPISDMKEADSTRHNAQLSNDLMYNQIGLFYGENTNPMDVYKIHMLYYEYEFYTIKDIIYHVNGWTPTKK